MAFGVIRLPEVWPIFASNTKSPDATRNGLSAAEAAPRAKLGQRIVEVVCVVGCFAVIILALDWGVTEPPTGAPRASPEERVRELLDPARSVYLSGSARGEERDSK